MNGKEEKKDRVWLKTIITFGTVCAILAIGVLCLVSTAQPGTDPRGGGTYDFESLEELHSILPEDNYMRNFPLDGMKIHSTKGRCKTGTTDFGDYEQYFAFYISAYDEMGNIVRFDCEIDDPHSSRHPKEWLSMSFRKDTTEEFEIGGVKVYYTYYSGRQRAIFYVDSDVYDIQTANQDKEVFIEMLNRILE